MDEYILKVACPTKPFRTDGGYILAYGQFGSEFEGVHLYAFHLSAYRLGGRMYRKLPYEKPTFIGSPWGMPSIYAIYEGKGIDVSEETAPHRHKFAELEVPTIEKLVEKRTLRKLEEKFNLSGGHWYLFPN